MKLIVNALVIIASALLSGLGFALSYGLYFSFAGMLLTIYLLSKSDKLSTSLLISYCYLFGLAYFAVVMSWMFNIHTTELIEDTFLAGFFKFLTLFLVVSILATGFVIFAWLYKFFKFKFYQPIALIVIPSLWVIGEYFRSVFFSVFSYGPGGSIGPYWNFGTVGLYLADTPIKYAARIVGMYGLSFLVVMSAIAIVYVLQKRYRYGLVLFVPVIIALAGWWFYLPETNSRINVGVVSIEDQTDDGYQDELNTQLTKTDLDLLVLPEYSNYFLDSNGKKKQHNLPNPPQLSIDTATAQSGTYKYQNIVNYYDSSGDILDSQGKSFLIPGGEYIPYIYSFILVLSGNELFATDFNENYSVVRSDKPEEVFVYKGVAYGTIACSGAIAPHTYAKLARNGAQVLVNSASISTLGVSRNYYRQADQMSTFTAVANARPFLQSARGGYSYIKNSDGNTVRKVKSNRQAEITAGAVNPQSKKTIYTAYGEWVVIASVGFVIYLFIVKPRKRLANKS